MNYELNKPNAANVDPVTSQIPLVAWKELATLLFLGTFGGHKFLAKNNRSGILYASTFGMFGLWTASDVYAAVTINREKYGLPNNVAEKVEWIGKMFFQIIYTAISIFFLLLLLKPFSFARGFSGGLVVFWFLTWELYFLIYFIKCFKSNS